MTAHAKVGGAFKDVNEIHCKVGGSWKEVTEGHTKIGGVWKQFFTSVEPESGDFELLETTILTSSTSSVSFTGLGSYTDYKHLQLRTVLIEDNGTTNLRPMRISLNGDSSSSYAQHNLRTAVNTSTVVSGGGTNLTDIPVDNMVGTNLDSNNFIPCIVDIFDFASTSKNTTIRAFGGGLVSGGEEGVSLRSSLYANTAAITSITVSANSNNFLSGSRLSLYGIRG